MAGLNGSSINGSSLDLTNPLYGQMQEATPEWPPAVGSWPHSEMDEIEMERSQLEADIASARALAAAARLRIVDRDAELRAALHTELVASQQHLAEMERQQELTVAFVREAAQAEVDRILAEARRQIEDRSAEATRTEPPEVNNAG
jgi:hypothetical protein